MKFCVVKREYVTSYFAAFGNPCTRLAQTMPEHNLRRMYGNFSEIMYATGVWVIDTRVSIFRISQYSFAINSRAAETGSV